MGLPEPMRKSCSKRVAETEATDKVGGAREWAEGDTTMGGRDQGARMAQITFALKIYRLG